MRFVFTSFAEQDIDSIASYLQEIPQAPALKIGVALQEAIKTFTSNPRLGRTDPELSATCAQDVLRYNCGQYVFFYRITPPLVQVLGILHGKRDIEFIMRQRIE